MDSFFSVILVIVVIGAAFALLWRKIAALAKPSQDPAMTMLNQNVHAVQERIDRSAALVERQLTAANEAVTRVSKELGSVQEMGRQMQSLQEFLRSPKLRGNIGEQVLRDLLEQYFAHEHIGFQHKFRDGQIVDAIVKTDKGIIPIDAKFPLENFRKFADGTDEEQRASARHEFLKDVKKHITDISKKYILPSEGTVDFAVMYVPSEAVYYEVIRDDNDLQTIAYEKKVFLVSPNSFYYFLKILMVGMEGKKIEENIREVLALLGGIHQDATRFGDVLGTLTTHVTNAKAAVDRVNTEYAKLSGKIDQVKLLK